MEETVIESIDDDCRIEIQQRNEDNAPDSNVRQRVTRNPKVTSAQPTIQQKRKRCRRRRPKVLIPRSYEAVSENQITKPKRMVRSSLSHHVHVHVHRPYRTKGELQSLEVFGIGLKRFHESVQAPERSEHLKQNLGWRYPVPNPVPWK